MAIQSKKKPTIKKGEGYVYNPATFHDEHYIEDFVVVEDPEELLRQISPLEYRGRKFITFDTETHPHFKSSHEVPKGVVRRWVGSGKKATPQDYPFCMSICDGKKAYTIYDSIANGFAKFKKLAPLFEDPTVEKIAHNAKYDMHMFANAGLVIKGKIHDTVVLAKLANENRHSFALVDLAARCKGITKFEYMVDNYKMTAKITDYRDIPRQLMDMYANADVYNAMKLFIKEYDKMIEDDLEELYENELANTIVLYTMERHGMHSDKDYEVPLKAELAELVQSAEAIIYEEAGKVFNINSGKQLYNVLLDSGVDSTLIKITDKGNPVLDKDALAYLADVHNVSIVEKILEFRKYEKLLGTYAIGIYGQKDSLDNVHGSINQTEATTGRMSITKPALQTLPKKDTRIRRIFLPRAEEYSLWFMDLDQVEYRLFAHYAKIPSLIEAIKKGYDVHAATAAALYNKPIEEVTDDERSRAKTINFALIYGMGVDALAAALKMTVTAATELKARYFAQIPEARPFINTVQQVIKVRGQVRNFYKRLRRLDSNSAYKGPNALIQGCAADYIKHKLVRMYKYLRYNELKTLLENIVHDEIILDVHESELDQLSTLRWLMSDFESFRCPITAGVEKGEPSWGQKVEPADIGFTEPTNMDFLNYDLYDGHVFKIDKEAA